MTMLSRAEKDDLFEHEALCHREGLLSYAMHLTHNGRDAEDLVQDTFMRAYRHFDRYEPGTNCKAWLSRIMLNEFITSYRHERREDGCVDRNAEVDENRTLAPDPFIPDSDYVEDSSYFGDEVSAALERVPDDFRAIVVMADLQDRSYQEISDQLKIPIGTVMSRLFRGRQILRQKLRSYALRLGILRA